MRIGISVWHFMLFSSLLLCCFFTVNYLMELEQQEENIRAAIQELDGDKDDLYQQVKFIASELEDTEDKKQELKEVLELRYSNYIIASKLEAADMPILTRSGFSPDMFERAWEELEADRLKGSGKEFVKAEEATGVNALVLAAICVHETNWGKSDLARYKNNYFGWGAFDFSPYESAATFESREESINHAAKSLRKDYLSKEGRFYRGEDLYSVNEMYARDEEWANKVADVMRVIASHALEDSADVEDYFNEKKSMEIKTLGN